MLTLISHILKLGYLFDNIKIMKVIVASLVKTGTKSISACLTELDYNVYDLLDHCHHHMSEWEKIFAEGVTTEQLRKMYKGVDAVVDQPASGLWEELSIAFPEAKVRLRMLQSFIVGVGDILGSDIN